MSPLAWSHLGADGGLHAHDGQIIGSLIDGALHPLTGMDHLAAMLSVGAWSALSLNASDRKLDLKAMVTAPTAFACTLLAGALAGMAGVTVPGTEPMIAASLLVLGLLVATRLKLGKGTGAALVAMFALFHGLAHGTELGGHAMAALTGMVASTALLHGIGMAAGLALRDQGHGASRWASRLAGGGVALLGLGMLTPAIAAAI
ncbi:MAG: HupE/UreJ family protein [Aquabacterium sp.]|nr:MAG: HupE/UreJ family protein [Aquabacterium sp.]